MRIKIEKKYAEKYNEINMELGGQRNKLGDLVFYHEKEKKKILEKAIVLQQDLANSLISIMHHCKLKKKKIKDVNIEEGYIDVED